MEGNLKELRVKAMELPESPGVYIMKNKLSETIYIGKAKALKKRVSQYFGSQNAHTEKVKKMVSQVVFFTYIVTDSEFEALVLECSLIKLHMPRYNILLKDDKGYNYVMITNDEWPRILSTNKIEDQNSNYIGPYMSSWAVKKAVDEVRKIFLLPSCNRSFSKKRINGRPCLNYYINQCCAPCVGLVKQQIYCEYIKDAVNFLKRGEGFSISDMIAQMKEASENLEFERAAKIRDRIAAIKKLSNKQKVVEIKIKNQDIIALAQEEKSACFEVFKIRDGLLTDKEEFIIGEFLSEETARSEFIQQFYSIRKDIPAQITLDGHIDDCKSLEEWLYTMAKKRVRITVPQKGENAKLVLMCQNNAKENLSRIKDNVKSNNDVLNDLMECLSLENKPLYIEAYDISNLYGSDNVAGMIVYENAKPNKKMYKRFKIKGVIGQDDYGSMKEVINRRLDEFEKTRSTENSKGFARLPDLILLDGGKGHVGVVKSILDERGYSVPVFGMVKDNKHRTRAISKDNGEISISKNQRLFIFVTKIQDEVHRFAISYHRIKKRKGTLKTKLMEIPGVGESRANILFKHFKTMSRIREASLDELILLPELNEKVCMSIYRHFHQDE